MCESLCCTLNFCSETLTSRDRKGSTQKGNKIKDFGVKNKSPFAQPQLFLKIINPYFTNIYINNFEFDGTNTSKKFT